jgi:hypothetical protein
MLLEIDLGPRLGNPEFCIHALSDIYDELKLIWCINYVPVR